MTDFDKKYEEKILNPTIPEELKDNNSKDLPTTMTDEDVEMVKDVMSQTKDFAWEEAQKQAAESDGVGYDTTATVRVNPDTGEKQIIDTKEESPYITESFDEFIANHENDEIDLTINPDAVKKNINDNFPQVPESEMIEFIDALQAYQAGNMTPREAYMKLPKVMKDHLHKNAANAGIGPTQIQKYIPNLVKNMLEAVIHDSAFDKYIIDMNTQLDAIYKEFGHEANKFYEDSINEKIADLNDVKSQLDPEQDKEKIDAINDIIEGLDESINLTGLKEAAHRIKIKGIDIEQPFKLLNEFNFKYEKSKYSIQNISNIFPILWKRVGIEKEDCVIFAICFCKYCMNMKPTNLKEHIFMYYTIYNIIALAASVDEYSEIGQKVVDNIKEVIDICKEKMANRQQDNTKPKKKKK